MLTQVTSALGLITLLLIAKKAVSFIWLYRRPSNLHKYLHAGAGQPAWALVTGATAGIGKALAQELATAGFNVVLHGRNASKLEDARTELAKAHPAHEFRTLRIDAATCHVDAEAWMAAVRETAMDINLTVLVNNAGGSGYPAYGLLEDREPSYILDTIHLNAVFPTLLTSALIPALVKNAPALILNIGSLSDNGLPLISAYAGAKTMSHTVTMSVAREMALNGRDVEVISHRVGKVTETQGVKAPSDFGTPTAKTLAKAVLARTGCGRKSVVSYWGHGLQQAMVEISPNWMVDRFVNDIMAKLWKEELEELKKGR